MNDVKDIDPLAADLADAVRLLGASDRLYQEILSILRETVANDGTPQIEAFARRLNKSLTDFAPRDVEVRNFLSRRGGA